MAAGDAEPGRGALPTRNAVLGTTQLSFGIDQLTQAVKDNTRLLKEEAHSLNPHADAVHASRFASNPAAQKQWDDRLAARSEYNARAAQKRTQDANSQAAFHQAARQSMRDQLAASAAANSSPPPMSAFPKNNGGYTGGVPSSSLPSSPIGTPGYMAQRPQTPAGSMGWYQQYYSQSRLVLPNGGTQGPGGAQGGGGGGGGIGGAVMSRAAGGGAVGGGGSGALGGAAAVGLGVAGGVIGAGANALNGYSQRMLNSDYDQFGNLAVLRNGGYSGMTYGDASGQQINKLRAFRNVATSPGDLIGGGSQILVNSNSQTFGQNAANAGTSAFLSPGMGFGQAAQNQQQEGTNQANVMARMLFGVGTRLPGGGQRSEVSLANAILNTTNWGQGTRGITPGKLSDMLQQGGSLRTNLNTYAQAAGLGPEATDSLANILTAQAAYQSKYGSANDFESTVTAASQGDKAAIDKLKGTGIGESVEQSILTRQGTQIGRDMNSQSSYIDGIKKSNEWLEKISNSLTAIMKASGADKALGAAGGANAASGGMLGRLGKTAGYAAAGAAVGSVVPVIGTGTGAVLGGIYGFISGGASSDTSSHSQGQNATASSTTVSGAANQAVTYAQAQVGKKYVSGAVGPNAYDCSGLMMAAYKSAGVSIPRVSSQQFQFGKDVPLNQIAPGDLVFPKGEDGMNGAPAGLPGHVMMALSGGPNVSIVEAANPSVGVRDSVINVANIKGVRRVTDGVGTLSPNLNQSPTGASTTNTSTTAGKSQVAGAAVNGMNEIDVLGGVLGRAAYQGPASIPGSAQVNRNLSVNGTSSIASYAKGVARVDGDQTVDVHDGELILDSKLSRSVRAALMADVPSHTNAGSSQPVALNFSSGSVVINVAGSPGALSMQDAAKQFVSAVANDQRIQQIGEGL